MTKGDTHIKKYNKQKRIIFNNNLKIPNINEGEMIGQIISGLGSRRFLINIINDNYSINASALRSFSAGPTKEIIKVKDYVIVQTGISKNQYFINHKYSDAEVIKLYDLNYISKPTQSSIIDKDDIFDNQVDNNVEELSLDDIWDI